MKSSKSRSGYEKDAEKFPFSGAARALEREGKWRDLLLILGSWLHDGHAAEMPMRWRAGAARAYAFLGEAEHAASLLSGLRGAPEARIGPEARAVALLADATLMRQAHNWGANEALADAALEIALSHGLVDAEADARFARALSWAEAGRWPKALDEFQTLRLDPRPISPYRRGLAAMNEGWALWDSGQPDLLIDVVPSMPAAYRTKPQVFAAAREDRARWLRDRIVGGFGVEIPLGDEIQIAMILCEWQCLASFDRVQDIGRSWLWARIEQLMGSGSDTARRKLSASRALLVGRQVPWPEAGLRRDAILYVELANLSALSEASVCARRGQEAYVGRLLPLLKELRIRSPLLPALDELRAGSSGWARRLAAAIGLADACAANRAPAPKLALDGWRLKREGEANELSFEKSPASRTLLELLAGREGQTFRKEDIHVRLTGTPYRKDLHDPRLHKLLKRLADRVESRLGARPWTMPGNNTVALTADLEMR